MRRSLKPAVKSPSSEPDNAFLLEVSLRIVPVEDSRRTADYRKEIKERNLEEVKGVQTSK